MPNNELLTIDNIFYQEISVSEELRANSLSKEEVIKFREIVGYYEHNKRSSDDSHILTSMIQSYKSRRNWLIASLLPLLTIMGGAIYYFSQVETSIEYIEKNIEKLNKDIDNKASKISVIENKNKILKIDNILEKNRSYLNQ